MRVLSPAAATLLSQRRVSTFFLVTIGDTMRYTSMPYDITMGDSLEYMSDGGLVDIEPPRLSSSVDRETYKLTMSDTAFNFRPLFETGMVGKQLIVRVGLINTTDDPILDAGGEYVQPDMPLINMDDTFIAYKGIIDSHGYEIEPADGYVKLGIEGSSPMADLDMTRSFFTSKDELRARNPNDCAFDQVFQGSGEISLKWGKV